MYRNFTRLAVFYLIVIIITTGLVAYAMKTEKDNTLEGDWTSTAYQLTLNKGAFTLRQRGEAVIQTTYALARRNGTTVILPSQDWFVNNRYYDVSVKSAKGKLILTLTDSDGNNMNYLLDKGGQ